MASKLALFLLFLAAACAANSAHTENEKEEHLMKVFQEKMRERKLQDKMQAEEKVRASVYMLDRIQ